MPRLLPAALPALLFPLALLVGWSGPAAAATPTLSSDPIHAETELSDAAPPRLQVASERGFWSNVRRIFRGFAKKEEQETKEEVAVREAAPVNAAAAPATNWREPVHIPVRTPRGFAFESESALREPRDTWERIRLLMTLVPVAPEVSSLRGFQQKLRRYHGNQKFFNEMSERARPWLHYVAQQLAARNLPGELALLPAVESNYNTNAVSPRKAAGLWQILPTTGRELRLGNSWWYDGRRDVPAATRAALDYLEFLRDTFNGDWLLAVAAYNSGPGKVQRAIRRAKLRPETATWPAIERYLPRETRGHVARWLVLSEVVAFPRLHNVELAPVPPRAYFAEVTSKSQIRLASAARMAGVSLPELTRLNPGLTRGITAPNGPHRLLVPAEHANRLTVALQRPRPAPAASTATFAAGEGRHRIRAGETLGAIARAHGTTVRTLMAANGLTSADFIRAGDVLRVPAPLRQASVSPSAGGVAAATPDVHIVAPGDSLWIISRRYNINIGKLRDWNRIAPGASTLHPGQKIRIPR